MAIEKKYRVYNHAKTKLRYHIIFSTKYRRKCLDDIRNEVLASFRLAESMSHFKILVMEIDSYQIHFLITFPPAYSIEQTVRRMKMVSTRYLYEHCEADLRQYYWKGKRIIWTNGYFCSTIGEVSEERLKHYIENQG